MEHKGKPIVNQPDFRAYPAEEVKDCFGNAVKIIFCEELVGGRWEPYYTYSWEKEGQNG